MGFADLVVRRYSVRAYRPDPVDEATLARILEVVRLAPSAANRQAFGIVVVPTAGREADLRRVYGEEWFVAAPLVVAVCAIPAEAWVRRSDGWSAAETDATIAMSHLILAATEEGLGTCWVASFDGGAAREVLGLPDGVDPIAMTPLGYPDDSPEEKERKPLETIVHRGAW